MLWVFYVSSGTTNNWRDVNANVSQLALGLCEAADVYTLR